MAAQERDVATRGICRISGLFRTGRRKDRSRTRSRRRGATDDRARGQRPGIRPRLCAAPGAARLSRWRRGRACWNFPRADEGRAAAGRLSHAGGAAPVLRGSDARAAPAHAEDRGEQALEAFAVSRRHPERRADQRARKRRAACAPAAALSTAPMRTERNALPAVRRRTGGARVIFAHRRVGLAYRPPVPEPLKTEPFGDRAPGICPQKYLFGAPGESAAVRARGHVRQRDAQHDQIFHRRVAQGATSCRSRKWRRKFSREWTSAGFEDEYQEQEYKKRRRRPIARVPRKHAGLASESHRAGKNILRSTGTTSSSPGEWTRSIALGPRPRRNRGLQDGKPHTEDESAKRTCN